MSTTTTAPPTPPATPAATQTTATTAPAKLAPFGVLYADDEEQALKYFRKFLDKEYKVFTATSVKDAIAILDRDAAQIGVVVTDQRMPGQQGTELLAHIKDKHPNIVRIMTTAYAEIDDAIKAVNSGSIYKYLTKPVDAKLMKETVRAAMDLFISQGERDSIVQIKMSALRRMVVADRVESLANMAYGLVQHIRNSLTATYCFLDELDPANRADAPTGNSAPSSDALEMWKLAADERGRLLTMLEELQLATRDPRCQFGEPMQASELLRRATEAAAAAAKPHEVVSNATGELGTIKADAAQVVKAIEILAAYVSKHCKQGGKVSIVAKSVDAKSLSITISGEGDAWDEKNLAKLFVPFAFPDSDPSERGLGLISAFSIAHQHGGDILVHRTGATGPAFEVQLPFDPTTAVQAIPSEDLFQVVLR